VALALRLQAAEYVAANYCSGNLKSRTPPYHAASWAASNTTATAASDQLEVGYTVTGIA